MKKKEEHTVSALTEELGKALSSEDPEKQADLGGNTIEFEENIPGQAQKLSYHAITPTMKVKLLHPDAKMPTYAHDGDAGMDLFAVEHMQLNQPGVVFAVKTGIAIELPPGLHAEIRSRSGMALKSSVIVANSPATIDAGYRGELMVLLVSIRKPYKIEKGDRIAQLVISRHETPFVVAAESLSETERGSSGLGSTGK